MTKITLKRANKLLKVEESKLDRYLAYYVGDVLYEPDPEQPGKPCLTPTERDMLAKYQRVYELLDVGRTDAMIRQMLVKNYDVSERWAYEIVREAMTLYGITGKADKEGRRRASINYYRVLSNVAFKEKQYEAALRAQEKADRLEGLYDEDKVGLDPDDFKMPAKFVFVNDLKVFIKNQATDE